ncbi:hypothetical protein HK405_013838 [Cladochytrium tenue]|nr:hypothetical protein HK405_013838 [Cladochytrium tenue]
MPPPVRHHLPAVWAAAVTTAACPPAGFAAVAVTTAATIVRRSRFLPPLRPCTRVVTCRGLASSSNVALTADRNPNLKRGGFARIQQSDIDAFRSILSSAGASAVLVDEDDVAPFNEDWQKKFRGSSTLVLKPKTTEQVSAILKYCNDKHLAVVPQGGNTGLVGGSVPVFDEIVLSTSSMNAIESFDEVSGILTCQAGCILEVLDKWLAEKGFMMPLDLGAKGSCQIGGNVSTNAGGLRLLRYGSLHGTVLSMEVVTADGTVMKLGQPLRKDNTGYDLKHLFIGAEGTLGVVTSVSILTPRRPSSVNVAVLAVDDFTKVLEVFSKAKSQLNEILSAFEFWDAKAARLLLKHIKSARDPFNQEGSAPQTQPFYVLIETAGSNDEHDSEKLSKFLEALFERGVVVNGVLAENDTEMSAMWALRESITEACAKDGLGGNLKYDLSVPVTELYKCVEDMNARLEKAGLYGPESGRDGQVLGFGHMGDGNLHLNITGAAWDPAVLDTVEPFLYEWAPYIGYSKSEECVKAMKALKSAWDPKGILNPYKFLPL